MNQKLTEVEKHWLYILYDMGFRYLARDKISGSLYAYDVKPRLKCAGTYWVPSYDNGEMFEDVPDVLFKFIKNKPFEIIVENIELCQLKVRQALWDTKK